MIRILNLVDPQVSESKGWGIVNFEMNKSEVIGCEVGMVESNSSVRIPIKPDDYMDLTTVDGINVSVPAKLSVSEGPTGQYTPFIEVAEPDEDMTIMFIRFETEPGLIFNSVTMDNCAAISYEFTKENFLSTLTLAAVAIDRTKPNSIEFTYGLPGGRSLSTQSVVYSEATDPKLAPVLFRGTSYVDLIEEREIVLPTIDLEHYYHKQR